MAHLKAFKTALLSGSMVFATMAQAAPESMDDPSPPSDDVIIVTGTRTSDTTAFESAAPIQVVSADDLQRTGQPNLNQMLSLLVPSLVAQSFGGDTSAFTLSAKLRGLSPNHALVLINGKRRHPTSNLHASGDLFRGGAAPDLDLIPQGAIKRVEVLQDGAAAQYGSDAIGGVINIILSDADDGVSGFATVGQHYKSDGETYAGSVTMGQALGSDGSLTLTLFHRYHDHTQRGGADARYYNQDGSVLSTLSPELQAFYANVASRPRINRVRGDARSRLTTALANARYDFGGAEIYGFGSYGRRTGESFQNWRGPDRVIRGGAYGMPGTVVFYPNGFSPKIAIEEDDFAITGGIRGTAGDWGWDFSTTYGRDRVDLRTINSANAALFNDTGFTPTEFYNGAFIASEWTNNLDISRDIDLGLTKPMTFAFGAEYRENRYAIRRGDAASIYQEGGQGFPGFQPTDVGQYRRDNLAAYVNIAINPVEALTLDLAGRYERYSDFGNNLSGKLTVRYDVSDVFAIRSTVASGFRAPTLAEQYYSATSVSPLFAIVQLPANSAAAKVIGLDNLKPETSTNLSVGLVARPAARLTLTLDAYSIKIRDRIVGSGLLYGSAGFVISPAVLAAIAAHGNILDPSVLFQGVTAFNNGLDTRTRGADLAVAYQMQVGNGRLVWTLSANYNRTKITSVAPSPVQLAPQVLLDTAAQHAIEKGAPRTRVIAGALFTRGPLSILLRETLYGKASVLLDPAGINYVKNSSKTAFTTDLEVSYDVNQAVTLSVGANNLFDRPASTIQLTGPGGIPSDGQNIYDAPVPNSPYGINGGYYYARLAFSF